MLRMRVRDALRCMNRVRSNVLLSSCVNLFIAAAGAGLLSYPWAMLQQGVVPCIIFSIFFAAINAFTDMVRQITNHPPQPSPPPPRS